MKQKPSATMQQYGSFFVGKVPPQYRARYLEERRSTNLNRTLGLSLYIIIVQVALNLINILKPSDSKGEDIMNFVYLSLTTLTIGIVFLILSLLLRKKNAPFLRRILPCTLLYIYVIIQLIFLSFNLEMAAGMNCYIIALLLLSFFIIMPPIQSVLSILATCLAVILMMILSQDSNAAWNTVIMTDSWANLLIITILCAYASVTLYNMHLRHFLSSVRLEESNLQLLIAAQTDALTTLYNRRGFFDQLQHKWTEMHAKGGYLAVAMFDVDYFKGYNDRNGHLEGDACLFKIAQLLKGSLAATDSVLCRYGGEEFLALFRTDSFAQAQAVAELCRRSIEARNMTGAPQADGTHAAPITISCGLACVPVDETVSSDELIRAADTAVYLSKDKGRNNVTLAAGLAAPR